MKTQAEIFLEENYPKINTILKNTIDFKFPTLYGGILETIQAYSEQSKYNQDTASKILAAKDALVRGDKDGAYHQLYLIASPNIDKLGDDVWTELEFIANGGISQ